MDGNLLERAKKIKAVALDSDGVIFSSRILISEDGARFQERSRVDALGISLLRSAGIRVAVISGGSSVFLSTLTKQFNEMSSAKSGAWAPVSVLGGKHVLTKDKVALAEEWLASIGVSWDECAYMGDDLSDYDVMKKVGLRAVPSQAEEIIKQIAHYVAPRRGGDGAVRDLANLILEAQGIDPTSLATK